MSTVDIPEAFLQADIEVEIVHRKMEGKMVDILNKLFLRLYRKYITI